MVEFSRPVELARLADADNVHEIEANLAERTALAHRFGLVGLDRLTATACLRRVRGGTAIRVSGHLSADVTQACVVTLAPVPNRVEEDFMILYADTVSTEETRLGADADLSWPEPLPDGVLDIGEAVAQQLSLALDPYPRAPGVELDRRWSRAEADQENPFASLAALRKIPPPSGRA